MNLGEYIRAIPDFPIEGILFRDITPLLANPSALKEAVDTMSAPWEGQGIELVAATEARGFIFGSAIAYKLGAGFIPVRKSGRLPWKTYGAEYKLEYRSDVLQIHQDAIRPGQRVLLVDDLMATGGTAIAVVELIQKLGGKIAGISFLIELVDLAGRQLLDGYDVRSVIKLREAEQ